MLVPRRRVRGTSPKPCRAPAAALRPAKQPEPPHVHARPGAPPMALSAPVLRNGWTPPATFCAIMLQTHLAVALVPQAQPQRPLPRRLARRRAAHLARWVENKPARGVWFFLVGAWFGLGSLNPPGSWAPVSTCGRLAGLVGDGDAMADDLFSIKNEFYLGNYMGAINEAQSGDLELSSANDERDRDVIVRARARGAAAAVAAAAAAAAVAVRRSAPRPAACLRTGLPGPLPRPPPNAARPRAAGAADRRRGGCAVCLCFLSRSTGRTLRSASTISCRTRSRTTRRPPCRPSSSSPRTSRSR